MTPPAATRTRQQSDPDQKEQVTSRRTNQRGESNPDCAEDWSRRENVVAPPAEIGCCFFAVSYGTSYSRDLFLTGNRTLAEKTGSSFNAGHYFAMMSAVLVSVVESTRAYKAASRLVIATPPPAYVKPRHWLAGNWNTSRRSFRNRIEFRCFCRKRRTVGAN
ncbi:Nucleobase-ascorbate transporter 1 [Linum grandiflorum]